MKANRRKPIALLLAGAMMLGVLPLTGHSVSQASGDGIRNPRTTGGVTTWDCVWFGNYWQSDTNGDGTADKKDAKQPIKWRVLSVDGDDAFLVADKNLDCQKYNNTYTDMAWGTCTMRSWLNGYGAASNLEGKDYKDNNFMDNAFTSGEQAAIRTTTVVNEDNPEYGEEGGNDTQDKVYLLSIGEVMNPAYGFISTPDNTDTRKSLNTKYAADGGEIMSSHMYSAGSAGYWWLRSPGDGSQSASLVFGSGYVDMYGSDVNNVSRAVRPALHLNLNPSSDAISASGWTYAGTVSSDGRADEQAPPTLSPVSLHTSQPMVIKSVKNKKGKKIKITLGKKVEGATGYQVQYARNKKFTKAKKSKNVDKWTSVQTITGLKKGKTYYVRVRAYQKQSGKKVYGKWSKVKKIRIRK